MMMTVMEMVTIYGDFSVCIRLWTVLDEREGPPQQLGYINIVPACTHWGDFLSTSTFQTFPETIAKANDRIRKHPIPGLTGNQ